MGVQKVFNYPLKVNKINYTFMDSVSRMKWCHGQLQPCDIITPNSNISKLFT